MNNTMIRQNGFSLIEILVTVIILAIGFLGLASVQLMGTKNVANSQYRTLATYYAYDMAERMRANLAGVVADSYDDVDTATAKDPKCDPCNAVQQAELDAFRWKQSIEASQIDGGLPDGKGVVEYDSTDDVYNITVSWSDFIHHEESDATVKVDGKKPLSLLLTIKL